MSRTLIKIASRRVSSMGAYLFVRPPSRPPDSSRPLINLGIGDPDEGIRQEILAEAFSRAAREAANTRYPSGRGHPALRQAIARWMEFRHGVRFDPDREIAVLSGSKEGIAHLILAILNPKETLLTGSLAYPVYSRAAGLALGRVEIMPMKESSGFWIDYSRAKKAKAAVINYPNNPTGAPATLEQLRDFSRWAKKNNIFIISDAAYLELYFHGRPLPSIFEIPEARDRAVEFHSFSKAFGLPGLRLGWVCGQAQALDALLALKDTYDSGASNYVQSVGTYLLTMEERDGELGRLRQLYGERRSYFEGALREVGISSFITPATFYVWSRLPKRHFLDSLETLNMRAISGRGFGEEGTSWMRFALCSDLESLKQGMGRIRGLVEKQ